MRNKTFIQLLFNLGILMFIVGIVLGVLTYTNGIPFYFSLCFVTLSVLLVIVSSRMFRLHTLRRMDNYISSHSRIECHKCHTLNELDANYCKNCGNKLIKDETQK